MSALTPAAGLNAAADAVLPAGTYYVSAHSASPGTTGANEFSGGGYARQAVTVSAAVTAVNAISAGAIPNAGNVSCTHLGLWSAVTGGTYKQGFVVASPATAASLTFTSSAITHTAS